MVWVQAPDPDTLAGGRPRRDVLTERIEGIQVDAVFRQLGEFAQHRADTRFQKVSIELQPDVTRLSDRGDLTGEHRTQAGQIKLPDDTRLVRMAHEDRPVDTHALPISVVGVEQKVPTRPLHGFNQCRNIPDDSSLAQHRGLRTCREGRRQLQDGRSLLAGVADFRDCDRPAQPPWQCQQGRNP